jgi:hypothetical protein
VLQTAEEAYYAKNTSYAIGATAQDTLKTAGFLHNTDAGFSITAPVAPDVGYTITGPSGTC